MQRHPTEAALWIVHVTAAMVRAGRQRRTWLSPLPRALIQGASLQRRVSRRREHTSAWRQPADGIPRSSTGEWCKWPTAACLRTPQDLSHPGLQRAWSSEGDLTRHRPCSDSELQLLHGCLQ